MSDNPWLLQQTRRPESPVRLICFHHAGRGASCYGGWPAKLPAVVDMVTVQLPGRENRLRETALTDFQEAFEEIKDAWPLEDPRPLAVFGHSMGSLFAYEFARWIEHATPIELVHLFVSGRDAPQLPFPGDLLSSASDEQLCDIIQSLDGTPNEILKDPAWMAVLLPLLRADLQLCESYQYLQLAPLSCPLTVFGGEADATSTSAGLAAWQEHSQGEFCRQLLPGGHFFVATEEDAIVKTIGAALEAFAATQD